jgi:predicted exporter
VNGASQAGPWQAWQRALALLAWMLAMVAGGVVIARSHYSADLSAFLPASPDPGQQVLIEQLRSGVTARTLMLAIRGGEPSQRAEASRALGVALRALPEVEQVHNGDVSVWQASGAAQWLVTHRYHLSPDVTPERYTAQGLRESIDDTLALLGTPAGAMVKPLLEQDPTGETRRVAESMMPALSGAPVFGVDSRAQIEKEVHWLAAAGTVLAGALLLVAFGSMLRWGWPCCRWPPACWLGIAAVSLGFGGVHGITLGFGTTLIGEAVDYAIYYLIQARGRAAAYLAGASGMPGWPTVRLGLLTSSAASRRWCSPASRGWRSWGCSRWPAWWARRADHPLRDAGADAARRARQGLRAWLGRRAWACRCAGPAALRCALAAAGGGGGGALWRAAICGAPNSVR